MTIRPIKRDDVDTRNPMAICAHAYSYYLYWNAILSGQSGEWDKGYANGKADAFLQVAKGMSGRRSPLAVEDALDELVPEWRVAAHYPKASQAA